MQYPADTYGELTFKFLGTKVTLCFAKFGMVHVPWYEGNTLHDKACAFFRRKCFWNRHLR